MKKIIVPVLLTLLISGCSSNKMKPFCDRYNCKKIDLIQDNKFEKTIYWEFEFAAVFFDYDDIKTFIENKLEALNNEAGNRKKINDYAKCREHLESLFLISKRVDYLSLDVELLASKMTDLLESGNVKIMDKRTNKFQKDFMIFDKKEEFKIPEILNNEGHFLSMHRLTISHTYRYYCLSAGTIFFSNRDYLRCPYFYEPVIYPEIYDYPDIYEINAEFNRI